VAQTLTNSQEGTQSSDAFLARLPDNPVTDGTQTEWGETKSTPIE